MIHPNIDLPAITSNLEALGFEAITKLQFRRGFLDVRIVNGLIPEGLDFVPDVHFRISVYDQDSGAEGVWNCPIDSFRFDDE